MGKHLPYDFEHQTRRMWENRSKHPFGPYEDYEIDEIKKEIEEIKEELEKNRFSKMNPQTKEYYWRLLECAKRKKKKLQNDFYTDLYRNNREKWEKVATQRKN